MLHDGNISGANRNLRENPCKLQQKKRLNSQKKITHIDDMMIHNLVKYLVQTRLRSGLKFVIFISHKLSRVLTRYFTRLYIIISSTCVIFWVNLDVFLS